MTETCLICNQPAIQGRRGLCGIHYSRFIQARRALPEPERVEFERRLIAKKLLSPVRPSGKAVADDVFADVAAEVHGKPIKRQSFADEAAEIAREGEKEIDRAVRRHRAKNARVKQGKTRTARPKES